MKTTYDCMDPLVEVGTIECECCGRYDIIEHIIGANGEPIIVTGPYPTRRRTLKENDDGKY